jgi:hypothetical protein
MASTLQLPLLLTVYKLAAYLSETKHYDMFAAAPPIDVDKVAQLLDIGVTESDGPDVFSTLAPIVGKITLTEGGPAQIWINRTENAYPPRRRFTLAHEVGHFCLHRSAHRHEFIDDKHSMSRNESYWNRYESEANRFAAELLMPTHFIYSIGSQVINVYKAVNGAGEMPLDDFTNMMAIRFQVSHAAMSYRLKNIAIRRKIAAA